MLCSWALIRLKKFPMFFFFQAMKPPLRNVLYVLAIVAILESIFVIARFVNTGVTYYRLVRIHGLVNLEFLMLFGSMFIYYRLSTAFGWVLYLSLSLEGLQTFSFAHRCFSVSILMNVPNFFSICGVFSMFPSVIRFTRHFQTFFFWFLNKVLVFVENWTLDTQKKSDR